jgi:pimeloyl-ACP methyl ester carboxylesterase
VLLLIHGWPTSSIDWSGVVGQLSAGFRVCALDFPGYGFSGKPRGWGYSLSRDAELIEFYLSEVIGAEAAVVVAHDRGDSVALLLAARCAQGRPAARIEHLVLSNGNIFLPLSNLTQAQRQVLDADSGPQIAAALPAPVLAAGLGADRAPSDPNREPRCWWTPPANGCRPQQTCSARKIPPARTEHPAPRGRTATRAAPGHGA